MRDASQGSGARELDLSSLMCAQDGNAKQDHADDMALRAILAVGHADHGAPQNMELSEANLAHFQETQAHGTLEGATADLETLESAMADPDLDNEMADPDTLESGEERKRKRRARRRRRKRWRR